MLRWLTQVQLIPLCLTALPMARFVHMVWKLLCAQIAGRGGTDSADEMQVVAAPSSTHRYTPVARASGVQGRTSIRQPVRQRSESFFVNQARTSTVDDVRAWVPAAVDGTQAVMTVRVAIVDEPSTMDTTEDTTLLPVHEQQASQAAPTVPVAQHALADVSTPTAAANHAQPVAEEYRSRGAPAHQESPKSL
jgi:hypothetical protein